MQTDIKRMQTIEPRRWNMMADAAHDRFRARACEQQAARSNHSHQSSRAVKTIAQNINTPLLLLQFYKHADPKFKRKRILGANVKFYK